MIPSWKLSCMNLRAMPRHITLAWMIFGPHCPPPFMLLMHAVGTTIQRFGTPFRLNCTQCRVDSFWSLSGKDMLCMPDTEPNSWDQIWGAQALPLPRLLFRLSSRPNATLLAVSFVLAWHLIDTSLSVVATFGCEHRQRWCAVSRRIVESRATGDDRAPVPSRDRQFKKKKFPLAIQFCIQIARTTS